jgi:hypothetical protein
MKRIKYVVSLVVMSSIVLLGSIGGLVDAQNNTNDTTAATINLTNASSSPEDAKNMSVIEGTMNQTG